MVSDPLLVEFNIYLGVGVRQAILQAGTTLYLFYGAD
jgi:hypothetical protein